VALGHQCPLKYLKKAHNTMAKTTPDQGAGMSIKIKFKATLLMIAKTRNPTTIARTTIGIRSQNLTIEECEGGGCWFISVMEDS
jgi:hypothetical protein